MEHAAQLVVSSPRGNVRVYFLTEGELTIGRNTSNTIVLRDEKVSRKHATLECTSGTFVLTDGNSRHGTFVDGKRTESTELRGGELIEIGEYELQVKTAEDEATLESRSGALEEALEEEYIAIESGSEPTLVESLAGGQATLTVETDGVEASISDTRFARLVSFTPERTVEYQLTDDVVTLGRSEHNTVVIDDRAASGKHAQIEKHGNRFVLRDLGSKNGTLIAEQKISEHTLRNGVNFRIGGTQLVFKSAYEPAEVTLAGDLSAAPRKPVVVIPGIMGSELWRGDEMVWPMLRTVAASMNRLALPDQGLRLGRIARHMVVLPGFIKIDAYSKLVDFLEEELGYTSGDDLLEFPYDWRMDNRKSARKLQQAIETWRASENGPKGKVTLIAHSMGSLVARYFIQCLGGSDAVERVLFMGAPCFGAPQVVQGLVNGPRLLPLGIGNQGAQEVITSLESSYQLVPIYDCVVDHRGEPLDLFENDEWVLPEKREALHDAREFHREIGKKLDVPSTFIFGYGVKTVTRIRVERRGPEGWEKAKFILTKAGDNRVAERFAFLEGSDIHPVQQYHGALWNDADVQMRLRLDLLN